MLAVARERLDHRRSERHPIHTAAFATHPPPPMIAAPAPDINAAHGVAGDLAHARAGGVKKSEQPAGALIMRKLGRSTLWPVLHVRQHMLPEVVVKHALDSGRGGGSGVAPPGEGEGISTEIAHADQISEQGVDDRQRLANAAFTQWPRERTPARIAA